MSAWATNKLAEVCVLKSGTTVKKNLEQQAGDIPYLKVADMNLPGNEFEIVKSSRFLKNSDVRKTAIFPVGTTIFPKRGGAIFTNKKRLTTVPICADLNIMGVIPSDKLLPKFLYYYFLGVDMRVLGSGTAIPQINNYDIEPLVISFPSIPEQKRIVAILDEAFAGIDTAIANTEKNLANARELFDSTSQSIFLGGTDWEKKTLLELMELNWITSHLDGNHGGDYPRKSEFVEHGIPYISAKCIKDDSVDISLSKFLTPERASKLRKGIAQDRDVLFAHNATVGPVAMLYTDLEKIILGTSLTYYRCNTDYIFPEYLAHYMRSPVFKNQYELVMQQSTRNQVPITKQREFFHLIPPLDEQKEIADRLDGLRIEALRLEAVYKQKLASLSELKQSLLQKAFSGELTAENDKLMDEAVA